MFRYKLIIEYIGTNFHGMQKQKGLDTIQESVENVLKKLLKEKVTLHFSGRTDAGVHAKSQYTHFDTSKKIQKEYLFLLSINFFLRPKTIAAKYLELVNKDFHARFSAKMRYYEYRILNRRAPSVIEHERAWHIFKQIDLEKMQEAANILHGTHDFSSFRSRFCQSKSPVKKIEKISVSKHEDTISIKISAPSFLHHMVRNIVGSLFFAGIGKISILDFRNILEAKDRRFAKVMAPAYGLFFMNTDY